jgi:hypothetical protein
VHYFFILEQEMSVGAGGQLMVNRRFSSARAAVDAVDSWRKEFGGLHTGDNHVEQLFAWAGSSSTDR